MPTKDILQVIVTALPPELLPNITAHYIDIRFRDWASFVNIGKPDLKIIRRFFLGMAFFNKATLDRPSRIVLAVIKYGNQTWDSYIDKYYEHVSSEEHFTVRFRNRVSTNVLSIVHTPTRLSVLAN